MFPVRLLVATILYIFSPLVAARGHAELVSDPASWNSDFRTIIQPTKQCPGGTLDDLRSHMHVAGPYSPKEYRAADRGYLNFPQEVQDHDLVHSFYYSAQSPKGRHWGFGGYVIVRDTCIVHADIDGYDN